MIVQGDLNVSGGRVRINSDITFSDAGFAGRAGLASVHGFENTATGTWSVDIGGYLAGSWFGDILFWDLERHELVATFIGHADTVYELAFDPFGKFFVSCSLDKSLRKFERGMTLSPE